MTRQRVLLSAASLWALCVALGWGSARAQDAPPLISTAEVNSRVQILAARTDLDEAVRKRASDLYSQALSELAQEADFLARAQRAALRLEAAPRELEAAKAKLAALERPTLSFTSGSLSEAEAGLGAARRAVGEARAHAEALRREGEQKGERRRTLLDRQSAIRAQIQNLRPLASAPLPGTQPALAETVLARAQLTSAQAEAQALEQELAAEAARADLVAAQSVLATRELAYAEDLVKAWEDFVAKRRREDAAEQAKQARLLQEAARSSPQLSAIADETRSLAEKRLGKEGLNARRLATEAALKTHQAHLRQLRAGFARLRRRVEAGVPSQTLGILLRRQLEALPSTHELREERAALATPLASLQADLVEHEERREAIGDTERILARLAPPEGEGRAAFEDVAREALEKRREVLASLVSEQQRHLDDLLELDQVLHSLTQAEAELRSYAEERILWIPSVQGSLVPTAEEFRAGLAWLSDLEAGAAELRDQPRPSSLTLLLLAALSLALLLSLVWSRRGAPLDPAQGLNAAAWRAALRRTSPVLLLCALAFVTGNELGGGDHARAYGATLRTLSLYSSALAVLWGISPYTAGGVIRRLLLVSGPPFLLACALVAPMEHAPELAWTNALGRSAFVVAMLIQAAVLGWALRESQPLGAALRRNEGIVGRLAPFLAYLAAGLPLLTAALAIGGYYYTGLRLEIRFEGTLLAVLLALFTYDVLLAAFAAPAEAALPISGHSLYQAAAATSASASPALAPLSEVGPELGPGPSPEPSGLPTDPDAGASDPDTGAPSADPGPPRFDPAPPPAQADPDPELHGARREATIASQPAEEAPPPSESAPSESAPSDSAPIDSGPSESGTSESGTSEAGTSESGPSQEPGPGEVLASPPLDPTPAVASEIASSIGSADPSKSAQLSPEQAGEVAIVLGLKADESTERPKDLELNGTAELSPEEVSEHLVALASQAKDTVRVVVALGLVLALGALWADVLPALRRLRDLQLYPQVQVVDASRAALYPALEELAPSAAKEGPRAPAAAGGGASSAPSLSPLAPRPQTPASGEAEAAPLIVTAADLGVALLLVLVTLALVRSLPGALEFALIGRLPLDAGARYAASTVARYVVVFVGFGAAAQAVGIGWGRIQWLAAALTFGLAFGLQEIFANFISGLIILFERPVRVGDIVTLGDVTGKVTRVRMRATTITDWNRKELIIPNKELVTGRVINWTLTEAVTRTVIPIGIAYGSNVEEARRLILEAANAQSEVMQDPEASCWFEAFGDSVYQLQLRIWLPEPKHIPSARHEILERVRNSFAEAQIEIAFPQRDIHIRSVEPVMRFKQEGKR